MTYIRNSEMEFLEIDDEHLAAYDNETGDVHYIEGTGKVILEILEEGMTEAALIERLCEIYEGSAEEIADDVQNFLSELTQKKVVVLE